MNKKYLILNFLHGNGPYLRTLELAVAVNDLLEKNGLPRLGIIVPWVYKLRQKEILEQNFRSVISRDQNEIFLDEQLGALLWPLFYNEDKYEDSLKKLLTQGQEIEAKIQKYFAGGLRVQNLLGQETVIKQRDLVMAIGRCPLVDFGIQPSYYTGFGYMSEILDRAISVPEIAVSGEWLKRGRDYYRTLEEKHALRFIAEPATFSYLGSRPSIHHQEILTPPNSHQTVTPGWWQRLFIQPGVYTTITGVYSRMHLLGEVTKMGLKIYTHKPSLIPLSHRAAPTILGHHKVVLHFARIGWGSAWLSFFTNTPLITPPYDSKDDPEVFFNNLCVEKIGLGKVYRGQALEELLQWGEEYKNSVQKVKQQLLSNYGTVRGVPYTAEKIVEHFLRS